MSSKMVAVENHKQQKLAYSSDPDVFSYLIVIQILQNYILFKLRNVCNESLWGSTSILRINQ